MGKSKRGSRLRFGYPSRRDGWPDDNGEAWLGKGDDAAECTAVEEVDDCCEVSGSKCWTYSCWCGIFRFPWDDGGKNVVAAAGIVDVDDGSFSYWTLRTRP